MPDPETVTRYFGLVVVATPLAMLLAISLPSVFNRPLSETAINRIAQWSNFTGLLASLAVLGLMLGTGLRYVPVTLGSWVEIPHFHFHVKFVFDRLSVPFAIITYALCGTIGAFCSRYMHRERGFNRFFTMYAFFVTGMITASLAGTIETLFTGWELVGLSSAMLVGFYQERANPVRNGLHVWTVYRFSDAALLLASVFMHHLRGEGDFSRLTGGLPWPRGDVDLTTTQTLGIGLLLLFAASGKSALVPFSGWLPRAMEGPTPSSAIFYGALSVHLGAFLLLRISPILDESFVLSACVTATGLVTALYAVLVGRAQTDVKCGLCFASLAQVGIIVVEIGLGLRYLALIHILGHATLRTLQFLRAPTVLHDHRLMENALGRSLAPVVNGTAPAVPNRWQLWMYRFAMERGYLDALLLDYLVAPILSVFRMCDRIERAWTDWLAGGPSREAVPRRAPERVDDLI
jgi:NAD(P)H-quinone oxidoreductase subunit 5